MTESYNNQAEIQGFRLLLGESFAEVGRSGWHAQCPFEDHPGKRLPFSLLPGSIDGRILWQCAVCGMNGVGVHALAEAMEVSGDKAEELRRTVPVHDRSALDPLAFVEEASSRLLRDVNALEFLQRDRCINREIVESLRIGIDPYGFYTFPALDDAGDLLSIKGRRWRRPQGWHYLYGGYELFGQDALSSARKDGSTLLLCEGEPDTAAARSAGFPSLGVPRERAWKDEWDALFSGIDVVVCFDNDLTGQKGALAAAIAIREYASRVRILRWPDDRKPGHDVTNELRDNAVSSLRRLLSRAKPLPPDYGITEASNGIDWMGTPHARIPLDVLHDFSLKTIDMLVYCAIQARLDKRLEWTPIAHNTIAAEIGCIRLTVISSLKRLEEAGYIAVRRAPKCMRVENEYRLIGQRV